MAQRIVPTDLELLAPFAWVVQAFVHEFGTATSPASALVLCGLYLHPGQSQLELAENAGLSKFAVSRACGRMTAAGLLHVEQRGREKHYYLTPRAERFFERMLKGLRQIVVRYRTRALRRAGYLPREP